MVRRGSAVDRAARALPKRLVYYGCGLVVDQLHEGDDYAKLLPAYSIWLLDGVLWRETPQFHHAFRLTDAASGSVLDTLAIHTLELPKYNSEVFGFDARRPAGLVALLAAARPGLRGGRAVGGVSAAGDTPGVGDV